MIPGQQPNVPGMDFMKSFQGKMPPRHPPMYDQTNIEGLFRFLVTIPLGFVLCYMGYGVVAAAQMWAIAYACVALFLNIFRLVREFLVLHEFTSFFKHFLAFLVAYTLMYNVNLVFKTN